MNCKPLHTITRSSSPIKTFFMFFSASSSLSSAALTTTKARKSVFGANHQIRGSALPAKLLLSAIRQTAIDPELCHQNRAVCCVSLLKVFGADDVDFTKTRRNAMQMLSKNFTAMTTNFWFMVCRSFPIVSRRIRLIESISTRDGGPRKARGR